MLKKLPVRELIIVGLVIALLSVGYCTQKDNNLKVDKKELEKALDGVKVIQKRHKVLVDSLRKDDLIKDKIIVALREEVNTLQTGLAVKEAVLVQKKKEISKFTIKQSATFLADRYNTKAVTAEDNAVQMRDSIPALVISELAEKDVLLEKEASYKKIVVLQQDQINIVNGKLLNKNLELASKELEAEALQTGLDKSLDLNLKTENSLKKAKRASTLKTFVIITAAVGGFFIGKGISK